MLGIVRNCKNCKEFVVEFFIRCLHHVEMSQKHGDASQLKKQGEKKKAKTTVT